jgi:hypothetical protein
MVPYQSSTNFHHLTLRTYGGQGELNYTSPRSDLNGTRLQYNIPTNVYAVSNHTSYYQYDGLFTFKFTKPGKYTMKSGYWFFKEATYKTDKYVYQNETEEICISEAPLNAFCVLDSTYADYSTSLNVD